MTVENGAFDFNLLDESGAIIKQDDTNQVNVDDTNTQVDDTQTTDTNDDNKGAAKEPYTAEEIAEIIQNDGEVDVDRLSLEGKALMKAMQRGFTPKLQEAAAIRKEFEKLRAEVEQAKPAPQPKDIYEAYEQNPEEVNAHINSEIRRLVTENAHSNALQIENLRDLKEELRMRQFEAQRSRSEMQLAAQQTMAEIVKAVPDIATKQYELKKFAVEVLGYSEEELAQETSIARGLEAAKAIKRINQAYDKMNAGKTLQKKEVKQNAPQTEKPGSPHKAPDTTIKEKIRDAKQSGDWRSVFMELEE